MLYYTLMTEKHTDNSSYNHSHKKSAKSFAKGLDKAETHLIIFSDKRQATSDKRQATSDKQQSGINSRSAQTNSQLNTNFLTAHRTHKSKFLSLCVFYITHSIKPQRTQQTQMIIKECLTKPILKHLASLACSAVKLKNIRSFL